MLLTACKRASPRPASSFRVAATSSNRFVLSAVLVAMRQATETKVPSPAARGLRAMLPQVASIQVDWKWLSTNPVCLYEHADPRSPADPGP